MRLDDALEICREMDGVRPKPDACTMASLLLPAVTNTLPENVLYVKEMFVNLEKKSLVSWNIYIYKWRNVKWNPMQSLVLVFFKHVGIHEYVERKKLCPNLLTENSLIDMYAGCGSLEDAKRVFDRMKFRNVASWTSLISAYGMTGQGYNAVAFFTEMQNSGQDSDSIAFVATLSACSHS
ncbi:putative pentatricopeptide repeat-containing protein [Glycine max]|nr:putative pentatricopeptide repeat-containing protein [Glycine max]